MDQNNLFQRIKDLLSRVNVKTYIYGALVLLVIVFLIYYTKNNNQVKYLITNNSQTCRDIHGNPIKISDGEACLDLFGVAGAYGIDLSANSDADNNNIDYVNDDSNNVTLDMSKDLILTNIYLEQNGVTDDTTKGEILSNIIKTYQKSAQGKIYTINDLDIIRNENKTDYQAYYNDVSVIFQKYVQDMDNFKSSHPKSFSNLSVDDSGNIPDSLKQYIDDLVNINENFINSLLAVPATKSGSSYQLNLINLLHREDVYLKSLEQINTDPIKYLANGGDDYVKSLQSDSSKAINNFTNYFKNLGVTK